MSLKFHPVKQNDIEVGIEAAQLERDRDYFVLPHNTTYKVVVRNNNHLKCVAHISIDGDLQGKFIVPAFSTVKIERPDLVDKLFTFYLSNTNEAKQSGIVSGDSQNGLITIKCYLEKQAVREMMAFNVSNFSSSDFYGSASNSRSYGSNERYQDGGTGLSGKSHQTIVHTSFNQDDATECIFHLRLVGPGVESPFIQPLPGKRSLETRIPPSVYYSN